MHAKPEKIKESAFRKAMESLPKMLSKYNAGDYEALGDMCQAMCVVDEYCGRRSRKLRLKNELAVKEYREKIYSKMVALVIYDGAHAFKFSRKEVVKFVRGEFLHGDSDIRDERRLALHNFTFENNDEVTLEFAVTWSFVIFPGIRSSLGNTDSKTPFIQNIKFGDREIEVTQVESVVINAVYEFFQVLVGEKIPWQKVAMTNNLEAFRDRLGDEIVDVLLKEWPIIERWQQAQQVLVT